MLDLVFHLRRTGDRLGMEVLVMTNDRRALDAIVHAAVAFVGGNSEGGKVGQAFAAALFDIMFPASQVRMGNTNDPSAPIPGDVQAGTDGRFWLWAEVKQEAVFASEIQAFVDRVKAIGGDRAMYFALGNAFYPEHIDAEQLKRRAAKDRIQLTVYSAAEDALADMLPKAAGSLGMQADALANRFLHRLHEAQVTSALEQTWVAAIQRSGT